jgi:hypothetical protein
MKDDANLACARHRNPWNVTADSSWLRALDAIADAFDPALTLLALGAPGLRRSWRGWPAALRYGVAALAGLAMIYAVAALDARCGLWATLGLDYSTHTAYAVSLATTIICWDRHWAWALVCAVCGYAVLILVLGYHGPADVLTAAIVAAPSTWALNRIIRKHAGRAVP